MKKKNKTYNRETYHLVYKTPTDFDKHIARRYDRMTGSAYLPIILVKLQDGIITKDDLSAFSDETLQKIKLFVNRYE